MVNSQQLNADSPLGPVQSQQLTIYIYIPGSAVVDGSLGPDCSVTDV